MKFAIPAFAALATVAALAGCERPAPTTATTVVPVIQKETTRETIVQQPAPAAAPAPAQPATETTQTTTRSRETPYGTATKSETTTTKTTP